MEPVEVTAYVLHSVVSGLWVGSVLFVAGAVLPAVRGGGVEPEPLQRLGGRLVWISLSDGFDQQKVREPARNARPFYLAASAAAIGLLVVAGLLSANNAGFL